MNRKTIQDVDARLEVLHKRLTRTVNEINALRIKRKKMTTGRIKVPPPKGVKGKVAVGNSIGLTADEFGDVIPSFGPK